MKSGYQLDREMMVAWFRWMKAQEIADRARAEYERAARAMRKHIEEHKAKEAADGGEKGDKNNE
jgi:hypothetical protein